MSTYEVNRLRKSGQLKDAIDLALVDFEMYPNDPPTQSALFWVMYDMCINFLKESDIQSAQSLYERMIKFLPTMSDEQGWGRKKCTELMRHFDATAKIIADAEQLSKADPPTAYNTVQQMIAQPNQIAPMLHEQLGWVIYRYVKSIEKEENSYNVRCQLRDYLRLSNDKPSLLHSCIMLFALNFRRTHNDFVFHQFVKMWNIYKFRDEDFHPQKKDGGIEYQPLACEAAQASYESIVSRNDKTVETIRWLYQFHVLLTTKYPTDPRLYQLKATIATWLPGEY